MRSSAISPKRNRSSRARRREGVELGCTVHTLRRIRARAGRPSSRSGGLLSALPRRQYDALRAERLRNPFRALRAALREVVAPPLDLHVLEAGVSNRPQILLLDRRSSDAVRPELGI